MSHRHRLHRAAVAVSAVSFLLLSACGASTSSSEDASSDSAGPRSADAVAAQKVVDELTAVPTKIHQTTPLPEAPPKGKKIIWFNCDLPVCQIHGGGIEAAAKTAGWTFQKINYKSADPATLTSAFKRALTQDPAAVVVSGVPPEAGWASVIPAYQKAGVPIVTAYIGTAEGDLPDGVVANVAGPAEYDLYAKAVANWFIADSDGQGKAVIQRVDAYPILKSEADSLIRQIKAGCAKCDVSTEVQSSASDVATQKIVPAVVSALKRDRDATYVLGVTSSFLDALPSALAAAGLDKVKIAGPSPTLGGQANVKNGKFAMSSTHAAAQAGWIMTDVAIRAVMGLDIPPADELTTPTRILLPGGDFPVDQVIDEPVDYPAQFAKLWKLG